MNERYRYFSCAALCALLIVVASSAPAATAAPDDAAGPQAGELAGTSWRLVKIMSMDDTVRTPADPAVYTLAFSADGTVSLQADCNRGSGSWTSESPGQLRFGPIAATMAACPPGSLHDVYLAQFEWVRSYVLENGHLFLATMADGSIIEFEPLAAAAPAATVLGEAVPTEDAEALKAAILGALFERCKKEKGIEAGEEEVAAFVASLDRARKKDREKRETRLAEIEKRMASPDLPAAEREAVEAEHKRISEFLELLDAGTELTPEEETEAEARAFDVPRGNEVAGEAELRFSLQAFPADWTEGANAVGAVF